jgi:hypothetical protein
MMKENNFEELTNLITEENKYVFELMNFIKKKVFTFLDKLPNITPSIRFETLKNIMGQTFLKIKSDRLTFISLENDNLISTLKLKEIDSLVNSLLVNYNIYKINSIHKNDKLLLLSQYDPEFYEEVEVLNQKISTLFELELQPIKKLIIEEVNNHYDDYRKKYLNKQNSKNIPLKKQSYLKNIYPFLLHYQDDWTMDSFIAYAMNR